MPTSDEQRPSRWWMLAMTTDGWARGAHQRFRAGAHHLASFLVACCTGVVPDVEPWILESRDASPFRSHTVALRFWSTVVLPGVTRGRTRASGRATTPLTRHIVPARHLRRRRGSFAPCRPKLPPMRSKVRARARRARAIPFLRPRGDPSSFAFFLHRRSRSDAGDVRDARVPPASPSLTRLSPPSRRRPPERRAPRE